MQLFPNWLAIKPKSLLPCRLELGHHQVENRRRRSLERRAHDATTKWLGVVELCVSFSV